MTAKSMEQSPKRFNLNGRYVPIAEVNLGILNVGFGGVVYHGVTESEFEYNGWGGESA